MLRKTLIFASMLSPLVLLQPAVAQPLLFAPTAVAMQEAASTPTVNINTASAEQLAMALTGVGLKRAEAIIKLREQLGTFSDANQLMQVKGIGPRMLELNKDRIVL
ncbi:MULTISPECIES: ComEA family DNA-binding protein [Idiomarina]|uniref:ComEA family DNA-binding protein n=1 Tax=Idiomarina TaxID=135575 RepID=UPI002B4AE483|nr:helix-hairpin-helix domain-containing protein [Idiomarina sp. FeN1]